MLLYVFLPPFVNSDLSFTLACILSAKPAILISCEYSECKGQPLGVQLNPCQFQSAASKTVSFMLALVIPTRGPAEKLCLCML